MTRDDELRRAFHELSGLAGAAARPAVGVATLPRPRGVRSVPAGRGPGALVVAGLVGVLVAAVFVVVGPRSGDRPTVVVTSAPPALGASSTGSAPASPAWQPETSGQATSSTDPGSRVMFVRPTVTGRTLSVWFWATGTGTGRPEPTCLQVEPPTGTAVRVRLARVRLDSDAAYNYSGTMTFDDVPDGVVELVYRCDAGYEAARLGVLG